MRLRRNFAAAALTALLAACDAAAPPSGARSAEAQAPAAAETAEARLARTKGCFVCHAAERRGSAPAFADIAARYADDAAAGTRLAGKLRTGGGGAWGPVAMPPQPQLSDEEVRRLVRWILATPQIDKPAAQSRQ